MRTLGGDSLDAQDIVSFLMDIADSLCGLMLHRRQDHLRRGRQGKAKTDRGRPDGQVQPAERRRVRQRPRFTELKG